jgi:dynactin complex subunit
MSHASPSVGHAVSVHGSAAKVRYVGRTAFAEGKWFGVEFETAVGRNDGSVHGTRYFSCSPRHGLFVQLSHIHMTGETCSCSCSCERDVPEQHVSAWTALENVFEVEALKVD